MTHIINQSEIALYLATVRTGLASAMGRYGRKALDWQPYSATFVVTSNGREVYSGNNLAKAIEVYNEE